MSTPDLVVHRVRWFDGRLSFEVSEPADGTGRPFFYSRVAGYDYCCPDDLNHAIRVFIRAWQHRRPGMTFANKVHTPYLRRTYQELKAQQQRADLRLERARERCGYPVRGYPARASQ